MTHIGVTKRKQRLLCMLPDCQQRIEIKRRIRRKWYCSEDHFSDDAGRRKRLSPEGMAKSCPLRCARENCLAPISVPRLILGLEYCSEDCKTNRFQKIDKPEPLRRLIVATTIASVASAAVGAFLYDRRVGGVPPTPPVVNPPSVDPPYGHKARMTSWQADSLHKWKAKVPPRFDGASMQPRGPILYNELTMATRGLLTYTSSLADMGQAEFLVGSDSEIKNAFVVVLTSTTPELILTGARLLKGKRTSLPGEIRIPRNNQSMHDLQIKFDGNSIMAVLRERLYYCGSLKVSPGSVGLRAEPESNFRLYKAEIELDS